MSSTNDIRAGVGQEEGQIDEVRAAIEELEAGQSVSHDQVVEWLRSWGTAKEKQAPR